MIEGSIGIAPGFKVDVRTTSNRGFTPEELAQQCADKIVAVSDTAPEPVRAQAQAFKTQVEQLVAAYLKKAVQSDRTTVYNALQDAGHPELAEALKGI
jgi:major membrane immunogen (membrane-anchored lipoprotein)